LVVIIDPFTASSTLPHSSNAADPTSLSKECSGVNPHQSV